MFDKVVEWEFVKKEVENVCVRKGILRWGFRCRVLDFVMI